MIMTHANKNVVEQVLQTTKKMDEVLMAALQQALFQDQLVPQPEDNLLSKDTFNVGNHPLEKKSIFDKIPECQFEDSLQQKIANLKLTHFNQKRRDELFKRHRKDQQQKIISRKKQLQKKFEIKANIPKHFRSQFTLKIQQTNKMEAFPITFDDMEKLRPETDLNDTIVGNYLKILRFFFLPQHVEAKSYFYSSFFVEKLLDQYLKEEKLHDRDNSSLIEALKLKVTETYTNLKRWTRKVDIFEKDIVIFPINAFRHWFSIILLRPYALLADNPSEKFEILYCDSMFEKKQFMIASIRKYLQLQIKEKRGVKLEINEFNAPSYQLLLPRQTNTHDCGLYMLAYIQELINKRKDLENLSLIKNRRKLNLFPRSLIYTMRQRIKKMFLKLINAYTIEEKNEALTEYKGEKQQLLAEAESNDFDQVNQKECRKYEKMNISYMQGLNEQEKAFQCEIRFYLDPEVNFYEKDK